jgi:Fe-S oxidoreductase
LDRTLQALRPELRAGTPIVVLEPSCAAVFRSDAPNLLHGNEDVHRLASQTYTLGEILHRATPDWRPPRSDGRAIVQQHCHQHAVLHYTHEKELLDYTGVDTQVLDAGCCGLAGNFGFQRGHHEVSVACAEDKLLPALREMQPGTSVIADGFSCRTQIRDLARGCVPRHTASVLAEAVRSRALIA